jgi:hypothetical protein
VIFLAPNAPKAEKKVALRILPKYLREWFNEKYQ